MSKHTTGDWHLRDEGGELYIAADRYICKIDDWTITGAGSGYEEENKKLAEERDANIKLITAAPELLKALIGARYHLEYCGYGDNWERECAEDSGLENKINQALAKATNG